MKYPSWICYECGSKQGYVFNIEGVTFHDGDVEKNYCGWCLSYKSLTDPKNFGYPIFKNKDILSKQKRSHLKLLNNLRIKHLCELFINKKGDKND